MAEAAGLAIGGVALVALFKTASEALGLIQTARHCPRDVEVLACQLELEKARLLAWGKLMNFHNRNPPSNWFRSFPEAPLAAERSLSAIIGLLTDSQTLLDRYGLKNSPKTPSQSSAIVQFSPAARLQGHFGPNPTELGLQSAAPGVGLRARWAVLDKSKVERFIQDLRQLVDGLHQITPGVHAATSVEMSRQVQSVQDIEELELIEEAAHSPYPELSHAASVVIERSSYQGSRRGTSVVPFQESHLVDWRVSGDSWNVRNARPNQRTMAGSSREIPSISIERPSARGPSYSAMIPYQQPQFANSKISQVETWIEEVEPDNSDASSSSASDIMTLPTRWSADGPRPSTTGLIVPSPPKRLTGLKKMASMLSISSTETFAPRRTNDHALRLALFRAVHDGRQSDINEFRRQGADVHGLDESGLSVLHYAIQGYKINQLKAFAVPGSVPLAENQGKGVSLLHHLLEARMVRLQSCNSRNFRLSPPSPSFNTTGVYSWTGGLTTLEKDTRALLDIILPLHPTVTALDKDGRSVIERAIDECNLDFISAITNRSRVEMVERQDTSLLHRVIRCHNPQITDRLQLLKIMLKNGANVEARDNTHATPLIAAAQTCFCGGKGVEVLLQHGANLNVSDAHEKTPRDYAEVHQEQWPAAHAALMRWAAAGWLPPSNAVQLYQPQTPRTLNPQLRIDGLDYHDPSPSTGRIGPSGLSRNFATVEHILRNTYR